MGSVRHGRGGSLFDKHSLAILGMPPPCFASHSSSQQNVLVAETASRCCVENGGSEDAWWFYIVGPRDHCVGLRTRVTFSSESAFADGQS
jgi:hypothetical protein